MKMFLRGRPVLMLIPDELAPTYSLDTRSEPPSSRLKLHWVYPSGSDPSSPPPPPPPGQEGTEVLLVWGFSRRVGKALYHRCLCPGLGGLRGQDSSWTQEGAEEGAWLK